jgi:hypothetical protein
MYKPNDLERCVDGLLSYIRNVVPGVMCPSSRDCDPATNCPHSAERKLSVLYCQRATLATHIEETLGEAAADGDVATCRTALRVARDTLAPMLSDNLNSHEADASSWVGRNLVELINSALRHLSDRKG